MKFSLSSIILTNFRQYQGTQTLDFIPDSKKNVSIILGRNGAGKSNILNALTWCFYGVEVHKDQDSQKQDGMPIINTNELASLKPNESTYAEVIVHIKTDIGPWTIKRKVEGGKTALGQLYLDPPKLVVIHPVGGQDKYEEGEETQILINNLLPEALRNFFFIDGEQLREFFKFSTPQKISKAIDKVSQLELVYQAAEHLKEYEKQLRTNIRATTPQLQRVLQEIQTAENSISQIEADIAKYTEEFDKLEEELSKVEDYLRTYNVATISQLQNERDSLRVRIKALKKQIAEMEQDRNKYLVEIAPFIYLKSSLESSYALIEEKVKKGELPPRIKATFVRELLERGKCICGNDLSGEARSTLEEYSTKLALSELSEVSIVGKTTLEAIFDDIKDFPAKIDQYSVRIEEMIEELERMERRREHISEEISGHNIEEIKLYEDRRKYLSDKTSSLKGILRMKRSELEVVIAKLEEKKKEQEKELSKDKKNTVFKEKLSLVKKTQDVLASIEFSVKSKIRQQVEHNTFSNFHTLIRKKSAFETITIDDTYVVKVIHSHGYNVINDLSAGEYMILGLSFMSALMTISGFHAPVIIDTPLGKIDDEHRQYITTELPKFLSGTQLVFLVTPTELDSNVEKNLGPHLLPDNYYEIIENETNTVSKVVRHVC